MALFVIILGMIHLKRLDLDLGIILVVPWRFTSYKIATRFYITRLRRSKESETLAL
jgi:hypothetical protein